jgi:hypothetical protein
MISLVRRRAGILRLAAGFAAAGSLVTATGCQSSTPADDPVPTVQTVHGDLPVPAGVLPDVSVTPEPSTREDAERTGRAWYVTALRDPVSGSYAAALERRSLEQLPLDVPDNEQQRATLAVFLRDGQPADLVLSIEHGRFVCSGKANEKTCTVRVSLDDGAPRLVRFSVPRKVASTQLHLAGGDDARRLLAGIAKAKHLRIQPTIEPERSPEIEFALTGLSPAIAKVTRHSVAATAQSSSSEPGA